jgi:quercetin dioxygenase-like cupin family protein
VSQNAGRAPLRVIHRAADEAPATWALGLLFERLLTGEESGGVLDVSLVTQPPGTATPLHRHTREAEAFYLLAGLMTYQAGEEIYHLTAGDFIYLPLGLPHALRVTGTEPTRFLALTAPAGLMQLYDDVGTRAPERRLPGSDGPLLDAQIAAWNGLAGRYGLQVLGPPLPVDA